jgi:hypothetical protein
MLIVDETAWPLVVIRWQAPVCACDLARYRARFDHWLQKATRFALVSALETPVHLPECALRSMAHWLHEHRWLIEQRCVGIASVFPADLMSDAVAQDYHREASENLGCIARAFNDESLAVAWALRRLRHYASSAWTNELTQPAARERLH